METKICAKCKIEKPLTAFSKHTAQHDGLRSRCKDCISAQDKKAYALKKDRVKARVHQWKLQHPELLSQYRKISRARHPEQYKAHLLVNDNPRLLVIKYECPCLSTNKVYHHPNYAKPFEVFKMCSVCHAAEHKRLRSEAAGCRL